MGQMEVLCNGPVCPVACICLQVVIPKTYETLTSRRVLTTQWIEGEAQQLHAVAL